MLDINLLQQVVVMRVMLWVLPKSCSAKCHGLNEVYLLFCWAVICPEKNG